MTLFAEIDNNNIVLRVLVIPNSQAERGQNYLSVDLNLGGTWIRTGEGSDNKNNAGIGYIYDSELKAFINPKPKEESIFNEKTCLWELKKKLHPSELKL